MEMRLHILIIIFCKIRLSTDRRVIEKFSIILNIKNNYNLI